MTSLALAIVLNGIDVLINDDFAQIQGLRIGLITNHTGLTSGGHSTVDIFHESDRVQLVRLFGPEHGIRGEVDASVGDSIDKKTGLKVHSLYNLEEQGEDRYKPTQSQLKGLDALVFDIQDIGARFYTYTGTMGYAMEAAAQAGIKFFVLDRPNPIGGVRVAGPVSDPEPRRLTNYHEIPTQHGMTAGELAMMYNEVRNIGVDLEVIWCKGWRRDMWWDETGLTWINPSPNMRTLTQAAVYPGICYVEATNISVGRGTDTPFELVGAPYIDGSKLAAALNSKSLPGIRFYPIKFTPDASKFEGEECGGIHMIVTDRDALEAVRVGAELSYELARLFPEWQKDKLNNLMHNKEASRITVEQGYAHAKAAWHDELEIFKALRDKHLHYR